MIHRTYLCLMPSNAATMEYLDVLVEGPVGSPAAPVKIAAGGTTPPAGWQVFPEAPTGDGQFCEWRSRTLRTPIRFGATGFVPRFRLGWRTSLYVADSALTALSLPSVVHSNSLVGALSAPWATTRIADPSYGPVVRIMNAAAVQGKALVLHLSVCEDKDEDRSPSGV